MKQHESMNVVSKTGLTNSNKRVAFTSFIFPAKQRSSRGFLDNLFVSLCGGSLLKGRNTDTSEDIKKCKKADLWNSRQEIIMLASCPAVMQSQ